MTVLVYLGLLVHGVICASVVVALLAGFWLPWSKATSIQLNIESYKMDDELGVHRHVIWPKPIYLQQHEKWYSTICVSVCLRNSLLR